MNAPLPSREADRFTAFEVGVLRRLEFDSVAIPFAGSPDVAWYLKIWRKRVLANDVAQSVWWSLRALVENDSERLCDDEIAALASPASPADLENPALLRWFAEPDAVWLDALRARAATIESPARRAFAMRAGLLATEYALSFTNETVLLRRPLNEAFADVARADRPPVDNGGRGVAANMDDEAFLTGATADLLYLRPPGPEGFAAARGRQAGIREVWVRGNDAFWDEVETSRRDRLGATFRSKRAYVAALDRLLDAAAAFPAVVTLWQDSSWLTAVELSEAIARHRRIRVVYSKDFSEVPSGLRVSAIVAGT